MSYGRFCSQFSSISIADQKRPKKVVLEKGPYVHEKDAQCAEANVVN